MSDKLEIIDVRSIIDDGQRAYRLRWSLRDCPNFDFDRHKRAWRAGYYSARDGISLDAAVSKFQES